MLTRQNSILNGTISILYAIVWRWMKLLDTEAEYKTWN